jgi:hypothetical protein
MTPGARDPRRLDDAAHTTVYRADDEFSAWPFNGGLWQVDGDEVLVAFFNNSCDYSVPDNLDHVRISTYGRLLTRRTRDGGRTWEDAGLIGESVPTSERVLYGPDPDLGPVDLSDPDVLLSSWSAWDFAAPDAQPWIRFSEDAGESWSRPSPLPMYQFEKIQGRPCYVTRPDGTIVLTLTGKSESDPYLRPIAYASFDGGRNWTFLSYVAGSDDYMTCLPSPTLLDDGRIVAAVRVNPTSTTLWTELYESADGGRTWSFLSRPNDTGAPGTLTELSDGRLLYVYGYRRPPYGIRARLSDDGGRTWGREYVLRDDGANADLGYPRTVELPDGDVLSVYYFNAPEADVPADGGVRYVAATRFSPPA